MPVGLPEVTWFARQLPCPVLGPSMPSPAGQSVPKDFCGKCLLPSSHSPPARLPPSLCSKRGGRLLSPFIPRPQISGGSWAAGRHRTDTCVPDLSSCACDTPSICGTSHVLLPVAFPGASWERSRGRWEGGSHGEIFKQRFAS